MPKFICSCGNVINLSSGTSDEERSLVLYSQVEKIGEEIDENRMPTSDKFYELLDHKRVEVIVCGNCGRLHLDKGNGEYNTYVLELS